jgi:hypothetical protein
MAGTRPTIFRAQPPAGRAGLLAPVTRQCSPRKAILYASTLVDNFDDNSQAPTWSQGQLKSTSTVTTGVTVSEANQRLEITPNSGSGTQAYSGYLSADTYNLQNDSVFVKISHSAAVPNGQETFLAFGDSQNAYLALIDDTQIKYQLVKGGVGVSNSGNFTYNSATHAWLRTRYDGTSLYLDTAPDTASDPPLSGDWTNRITLTPDAAVNFASGQIALNSGSFFSITPATARFDGFNTATTVASNEISGTTALTFVPSAAATGLGALTGSTTLTITPSGTATGLGMLAGSSTLAISPSGAAAGLGALAGSSSLVLSPSGTTTGLGNAAGTSALSFAPSGIATGLGALAGASMLVFAPSGAVAGLGSLLGSSTVAFSPTGAITGTGVLSGAASLALAGSGTATGIGELAGSSSLTLSNSGSVSGAGSLLASTALSWGLSGTVDTAATNELVGSSGLAFDALAAVSGLGQMAASTTFSLTISGQMVAGSFGRVKVHILNEWQAKPVKVWNGSAWVEKPLKRWDGAIWQAIGY